MLRTVDIHIELPEDAEITTTQRESAESAARDAAILDLYRSRAIGGYHAARLLGLDYYDFLDLLAMKGIPASIPAPHLDLLRPQQTQEGSRDTT